MKTEVEIKKQIEWLKNEYRELWLGRIPAMNIEAASKYYRGAINNLEWVLEE